MGDKRETPPAQQPLTTTSSAAIENETLNEDDANETPQVVIYHDSLCRNINETLMGRADVSVSKVWAPTNNETQIKVDEMESNVNIIVVQALTRDFGNMSAEKVTSDTHETVDKCLLKSEKVVVSLIVKRDDEDDTIQTKLEVVDANIRYHYLNNPRVLICHHDNLRNKMYRKRDSIHLTDDGNLVLQAI